MEIRSSALPRHATFNTLKIRPDSRLNIPTQASKNRLIGRQENKQAKTPTGKNRFQFLPKIHQQSPLAALDLSKCLELIVRKQWRGALDLMRSPAEVSFQINDVSCIFCPEELSGVLSQNSPHQKTESDQVNQAARIEKGHNGISQVEKKGKPEASWDSDVGKTLSPNELKMNTKFNVERLERLFVLKLAGNAILIWRSAVNQQPGDQYYGLSILQEIVDKRRMAGVFSGFTILKHALFDYQYRSIIMDHFCQSLAEVSLFQSGVGQVFRQLRLFNGLRLRQKNPSGLVGVLTRVIYAEAFEQTRRSSIEIVNIVAETDEPHGSALKLVETLSVLKKKSMLRGAFNQWKRPKKKIGLESIRFTVIYRNSEKLDAR